MIWRNLLTLAVLTHTRSDSFDYISWSCYEVHLSTSNQVAKFTVSEKGHGVARLINEDATDAR